MPLIRLEAAVMFGIALSQILSIAMSSPSSRCLASMHTCMSYLCKTEQAFYGGICEDEGCQIKGSKVCNMTIQTALDQFPSLQGCVCSWEEELCDSIQALATQCHRKPAAQEKRSTVMDWHSSTLIVPNSSGSCLDRMTVCVSDAVCNRYLVRVLQACMEENCDHDLCQEVTQQFFASMPHNVAEMLVMCECEAANKNCVQIKTALHGRTCGRETRICQDALNQCAEDSTCRDKLKTLRTKCWRSDQAQCSESDLLKDECFTQMDPALILGADSECKKAFMATLGTSLHYPCSCKGVPDDGLVTCNMIHDVFHNRSHFITFLKSSSGFPKPPEPGESEQGPSWSHDYPLYVFAAVLLVGVVILMPLAVLSKIWVLRRRDKIKFHQPQKSSCVAII